MKRRQSLPEQWLIVDAEGDDGQWRAATKLDFGSGLLVLGKPGSRELRRLHQIARQRRLAVAFEVEGEAARVHNMRELRQALLKRTALILLSPICLTSSHPDWRAVPQMRAAAMSRLAARRLVALGGMDARNFRRVQRLGFQAWAGISAFRT